MQAEGENEILRRYEDVCNERECMGMMGMVEKKELKEYYEEERTNEKNRRIKRIESESEMIRKIQEGKNEVEGTIYSRKEESCMYEYKVYIQGEGIKEIRMREKKEINKKYRFKRYIKEEKGLEVRMELLDANPYDRRSVEDRRDVGSATFVPYGCNLDRPSVGGRSEGIMPIM